MRRVRRAVKRAGQASVGGVGRPIAAGGLRVDLAYGDRGLKGAMRAADRSGARIALVAGDRDIEASTVEVKDLSTGEQVSVATDSLVAEVLSRLRR
ncbi:anticodon binding domain protein [Mycobacterium xenopi 3993]|nr:anticodon binding domain protein [Mycobacterium xenopi 3993]